jgi:hypothetical protein
MNNILTNWRTSLAGIAVLAMGAALASGKITVQQFLQGFAAICGAGFLVAQDGKVAEGQQSAGGDQPKEGSFKLNADR